MLLKGVLNMRLISLQPQKFMSHSKNTVNLHSIPLRTHRRHTPPVSIFCMSAAAATKLKSEFQGECVCAIMN